MRPFVPYVIRLIERAMEDFVVRTWPEKFRCGICHRTFVLNGPNFDKVCAHLRDSVWAYACDSRDYAVRTADEAILAIEALEQDDLQKAYEHLERARQIELHYLGPDTDEKLVYDVPLRVLKKYLVQRAYNE